MMFDMSYSRIVGDEKNIRSKYDHPEILWDKDASDADLELDGRAMSKPYGTPRIVDCLNIANKFFKEKSKQVPLTPLSQRGIKSFWKFTLFSDFLDTGSKIPEGRAVIVEIAKTLAKMEQFWLLERILLEETGDNPPAGHTLYRSEQRKNIMAVVNGLPEWRRKMFLGAVWSYPVGNCGKIGGEGIFSYGLVMPL
jgi:hypothetical protein